jgi:hypothetical protein
LSQPVPAVGLAVSDTCLAACDMWRNTVCGKVYRWLEHVVWQADTAWCRVVVVDRAN